MNKETIAYWVPTALFCAVLAFSGIAHFAHLAPMVESMTALGYPTYFMTIIGLAKLLGVIALLIPGFALLKEWAYAGFCFNLIGAVATHLFVSDPLSEWLPPLIMLAVGGASYHFRPTGRRLRISA